MATSLRFENRVVIVTGAGAGLGREHALEFARRGAKLVVNDLGGAHDGTGRGTAAADEVVREIHDLGAKAVANYDSVEDGERIVATALEHFGRVDAVINNAGILRDVSFARMGAEDWDLVQRVHVQGAYAVTRAAWPVMREQGFGRVIFTTSAAGLYGNFGQANYAAAKLALVGFMQTLALEGRKHGIQTAAIAPVARSRMTETAFPAELLASLEPRYVTPLVVRLCHESCEESGSIFEVGGGWIAKLRWERSEGVRFEGDFTAEQVEAKWDRLSDFTESTRPNSIRDSLEAVLGDRGGSR